MILRRGPITLEFDPHPGLDPAASGFGGGLRHDDGMAFFGAAVVPEGRSGFPRLHRLGREARGGLIGARIDPDGTLLRRIQT